MTARASRIACAVASLPLIAATIISAAGMSSTTSWASSISGGVTPMPVRSTRRIARATAWLTTGALWPSRTAPNAAW